MPTTSYNATENGDSFYQETDRSTGKVSRLTERRAQVRTAQTRTSVNTPNYRELVRSQRLPSNPYSFTRRVDRYPSGFDQIETGTILPNGQYRYYRIRNGLTDAITHGQPNVTGPSAGELAALDRKVVNDLLLKIKDQKINLAQATAERAQTAKTVGDAALRLAAAIRALRKGRLGDAAGALGIHGKVNRRDGRNYFKQQRAFASGWLELQYGWRPLLNDVYGAAEALAKAYYLPPVEKVVKVRKILTEKSNSVVVNSTASYTDIERSTTYIRYVCSFTTGSPVTKSLAELGITNPALVAWELVPWSFVIDWFVPIGDFISSLDATLGLQFQHGTKTVYLNGSTRRQITYGPSPGFGGVRSGWANCSCDQITVTRTKLSSFPSPRRPDFKNPVSVEHMLNAMALLRQLKR